MNLTKNTQKDIEKDKRTSKHRPKEWPLWYHKCNVPFN